MCEFLSVIVLRNGDILRDSYTDSHEQLISFYGLKDDGEPRLNRFVRVEFKPEDRKDYDKVDKYILNVDESETPAWFEEHRENVTDKLRSFIKNIILRDVNKDCLLSGVYILTGNTHIKQLINTRVFFMSGTSKVGVMWETSKVGVMWGTSKVGVMWETSKVGVMRETSKVG